MPLNRIITLVGAIVMLPAVAALALLQQDNPKAATQPDTSAITPEMVDLGRAIFHGQGTCFACHGQKLEGSQIAPTLMPHAWRDARNGEFANIYYVATHGVPSTLMVAFPGGISREQARAVAAYVWSVSTGKVKP
ncbi:MAG TPA: c-type cytochrome [Gemmatimonadaceae bacterium]|jgi:mono/diheme cytochrome c family protein|nr:c-type cytochrome [Gemmatimonadaceae bacterium]